jgi:hypothetical protein
MARRFGYYDDWKTPILQCLNCGWKGTFEQGSVDYFGALMDSSCPGCDTMLAIVSYPTSAETDANMDKLTDQEKREVSARKRFLAQWEAASLKSADQLPDLQGAELTLAWDWLENEQKHFTVIRHGHTEVWHELACYEGYERFQEILKILKAKYGSRLVDVVPTDASTLHLHGDSIRAIDIVQNIRKSLKQ